ncbi:MAG TPA: hypothetical protein VKV20_09215 [Ktedonobacteraceae bacterium]|jgi:hypothetical protein|nr:hypothetical protein [Ktedonobacteraceae bacterium]
MPQLHRFILHPMTGKVFLYTLGSAYLIYLVAFAHFLFGFPSLPPVGVTIVEHQVSTNPEFEINYWTKANMRNAVNTDPQTTSTSGLARQSSNQSAGKAAQQQGQLPGKKDLSYPLSTVGRVFLTNASGQNLSCSGTAVVSSNHSVVDTAGHCLYWQGSWMHNVIFCPMYANGSTPYGCWAARDLEVPSDWIDAAPNDLHHDFGMFIVAPNSEGQLTNVVGGAGWAYNQPANATFYAYGYPAGYPFDGQTRQTCPGATGIAWQHGGGTVVSIPCNMTGGSSGGPWFIQIKGNWYLNGHNDFTSSMQRDHMFSPYYDDTWYELYSKAQQA